jgi:hypothetical protein
MMPNREEILARAQQLFAEDCFRNGVANVTPENDELLENGFFAQAQTELMMNGETRFSQWEPEKPERLERQNENFDSVPDLDALLRSGTIVLGGSGCGKSTLAKAIVKELLKKGVTSYIIDSSRSWSSERYNVVKVSRDCKSYRWKYENTVFDVCTLSVNEKTIFANALAGSLMSAHISGTVDGAEILVLEEAELFLSNNSLRSHALENLLTLISTGRNFRVRFIAISQVPSGIDKLPIKLCEQRFFGRLSEPNDLRYIKQILLKEWTEELKRLETGCFIAENKGHIDRFRLDLEKPRSEGFNYAFSPIQICGV